MANNTELLVKNDIIFLNQDELFEHLFQEFSSRNIVKDSYRNAIKEREKSFPTGIQLENCAIAIPHCDAEHAIKPAIYVIKPAEQISFEQADGDDSVTVSIIIALVVTDPKQQLQVLRQLFKTLQDNEFVESILLGSEKEIFQLFESKISIEI